MLDPAIEQDSISALQFMRGFSLSIWRNCDGSIVIFKRVINYGFEIEPKYKVLIFDESGNSMVASLRTDKIFLEAGLLFGLFWKVPCWPTILFAA